MGRVRRIYVDFMKHGGNFVLLTTQGTLSDLRRHRIELREGMTLHLYQDDEGADGSRGYLYADGEAFQTEFNGRLCWAARLTSEIKFAPGDRMGPL